MMVVFTGVLYGDVLMHVFHDHWSCIVTSNVNYALEIVMYFLLW